MTWFGLAFGVFMLTAAGVGLIVYEIEHQEAFAQIDTEHHAGR